MFAKENKSFSLSDITFVKRISIGNLDPNNPMSEQSKEQQIELVNKCLNNFPKGKVIGKELSFAVYQIGEHQITMQVTTYHIGFFKKPHWID